MLVKVAAARREGAEATTIHDKPIGRSHAKPTPDGGLQLTFVAAGMYDKPSSRKASSQYRSSSQYRYTMILSRDELAILNGGRQG